MFNPIIPWNDVGYYKYKQTLILMPILMYLLFYNNITLDCEEKVFFSWGMTSEKLILWWYPEPKFVLAFTC